MLNTRLGYSNLKAISLVAVILVTSLARPSSADHFNFATPKRTWATFKFAIDTHDYVLFKKCLHPDEAREINHSGFEKFLHGDGRFAQTSRVIKTQYEGERATVSIDFYCRERDGRLLVDNDPVRFLKIGDRWLIEGI